MNQKVNSLNWIVRNNNQVKREAAIKVSLSTPNVETKHTVCIEELSKTKLLSY